MTREEIAEWVGFYFGIQHAVNLRRMPEEFVQPLLAKMREVEAKLPPDTINQWPNTTA